MIFIPKEALKNPTENDYAVNPEKRIIEKFELTEKGLLTYVKGWKYPIKGYPYPEMVDAVSYVKKFWLLCAEVIIRPWRIKRKVIEYTKFFLERFFLKPEFYCPLSQEILFIGGDISECLAMFLEGDNAYRFRVQISASGSVLGTLDELIRREQAENMRQKWVNLRRLYKILMWYPPFRKEIKRINENFNWEKVGLDEEDAYWAKQKPNFDWS